MSRVSLFFKTTTQNIRMLQASLFFKATTQNILVIIFRFLNLLNEGLKPVSVAHIHCSKHFTNSIKCKILLQQVNKVHRGHPLKYIKHIIYNFSLIT